MLDLLQNKSTTARAVRDAEKNDPASESELSFVFNRFIRRRRQIAIFTPLRPYIFKWDFLCEPAGRFFGFEKWWGIMPPAYPTGRAVDFRTSFSI